MPSIVGIESDPKFVKETKERFSSVSSVTIEQRDFLVSTDCKYDYVIGNPPYVSITKLSEQERFAFREKVRHGERPF